MRRILFLTTMLALDAWTSFCKTGNPGWPPYKHSDPFKQLFDVE